MQKAIMRFHMTETLKNTASQELRCMGNRVLLLWGEVKNKNLDEGDEYESNKSKEVRNLVNM